MGHLRIKLYDMMFALSCAMDLVAPELFNHHQQVAYLAYRLAEEMGLSKVEQQTLFMAGMLHDIGSLSIKERLGMLQQEQLETNSHAFRGAALLERYRPFAPLARIVRYHHIPWNHGEGEHYGGEAVPFASHVLHLADRACVLFNEKKNILLQVPSMMEQLSNGSGTAFTPASVKALAQLCQREYIWLELIDREPLHFVSKEASSHMGELDLDQVLEVSKLFSHAIDFRSRFTATHSASVAKAAQKLGELSGFSECECKMLLVAGYLHDLGKMAIDASILEKPGQLDPREYRIIRCHTFYTHLLLSKIPGLETINEWASYHHEKLTGNGYPYHLKGEELSYGSRIMAVADIFTALTEDRPYRKGMERDQVKAVLTGMVNNGAISEILVELLLSHYELFCGLREEGHAQALAEYEKILCCSEHP